MQNITNNEMLFVLSIFRNIGEEYNANNIAKHLGISSMGALKIARRLEAEGVIASKKYGKAKFYRINFDNNHTRLYIRFLLNRESEQVSPYIRVWIREIRKIKSADAAILFGSVLQKQKEARDVDVVLITDQKRFEKLKKEVSEVDFVNIKKLHPLYQTKKDFINNINKRDKPLLNAIKGIVVFGEDIIIKLFEKLK